MNKKIKKNRRLKKLINNIIKYKYSIFNNPHSRNYRNLRSPFILSKWNII